jgi:hypothetical protein
MKRLWTLMIAGLAMFASASSDGSLQMELQPGQSVQLELSSGDYQIEPGASDRLLVITKSRMDSQEQRPKFGIDANSKEASVRVDAPKNYAAVIQIPKNSNLRVRLRGGRLRVDGINGDKDIESYAGAVSIDIGQPQNYARVEASVDLGHIEAPAFQVAQEGFDKSFSREGPGSYRLHAHVGSGEINLYSRVLDN